MPLDWFREEVAWLASHCEVRTVGEAFDALAAEAPRPARPLVSITFDDGYWDNHDLAAPVLDGLGVRASFFVTSGFVATGRPLWWDRFLAWAPLRSARDLDSAARDLLAEEPPAKGPDAMREWLALLKQVPASVREGFLAWMEEGRPYPRAGADRPMTAAQLLSLAERGHEIGSHTVTHPILPLSTDAELDEELRASRAALQEWTGRAVNVLAYPNGDCDLRVREAARRAGYRLACATEAGAGPGDPGHLELRRIDVTSDRVGRDGRHDLTGFRSEACELRATLRRWGGQ
jgi:peptidoglycan/xylan/chitin deacetylase (PgdA/CDA1 family)